MVSDYSIGFVILMGIGTVFFGLVCLIVLATIMGALLGRQKQKPAQTAGTQAKNASVSAPGPAKFTPEIAAAVAAALGEELNRDITGIRIVSIKKL